MDYKVLEAGLPVDPPTAFLANPSANVVDLVWDANRSGPVTGYQVAWRLVGADEWQISTILYASLQRRAC